VARIRINVKGLVKFMTATAAGQCKVLQDYKYPSTAEPGSMRAYYNEAQRSIKEFHRNGHERDWLRAQAARLDDNARFQTERRSADRLRHNARALLQYEEHFGDRQYVLLPDQRLSLLFADVRVRVVPDMFVQDRTRDKIIVLGFQKNELTEREIKIHTQCVYEAALQVLPELESSSVLLCEISCGVAHRGARAGSRMRREIEASCENISALWDSIAPPPRRWAA